MNEITVVDCDCAFLKRKNADVGSVIEFFNNRKYFDC